LIAVFAVVPALKDLQDRFGEMAKSNPFFEGGYSDLLGLLPFVALAVVLYFVGRERLLSGKNNLN
jgi:hypothetical protein